MRNTSLGIFLSAAANLVGCPSGKINNEVFIAQRPSKVAHNYGGYYNLTMKTKLFLFIILAFTILSCSSSDNSAHINSYMLTTKNAVENDSWEEGYFVDSNNNFTKEKYIKHVCNGVFTKSTLKLVSAKVIFIASKNYIALDLFDFKEGIPAIVDKSSIVTLDMTCTLNNDSKKDFRVTNKTVSRDRKRIFFDDETIFKCFSESKLIDMDVKMQVEGDIATYNFKFNPTGFVMAYKKAFMPEVLVESAE